MPKYFANSKYFDDGAGVHIENGFIECLDLFINTISVEDLIQASADLIEVEVIALQNDVSALQTDVANLQTTLTTCSYDSATQTFVVGNNLKCLGTFTLYIGGTPYNVNTFITTTNTNIATNTTDITNIKTTLTNVSYNSSMGAFQIGGTTDCRILNTLYLYSSGIPYSVNTFVSDTNTNIVSLVNKTTNMSFSSGTTNFSGTLASDIFTINTSINGTSKARFNNIMTMCYDLSSNCQAQIDGAYAAAAAAVVAAGGALTAANTFTTDAIATYATAQALVDLGQDGSIDALEGKLTTYTYDATNNIVAITSRLNANSFGDLNFIGDLNQTYQANKNNTLRNPTYFQHNVELQNNKGFLIDIGSTFENNGISTLNGNLTCTGATSNFNSTTTQIGTSSASTLNIYANPKIYNVNTQIRNNLTTASGTLAPYLKLENIATNANSFKLQGVAIGKENIFGTEQSNCNMGYNFVSDGSTSNYGYLGLNVNASFNNTLECLKWSQSKVSISSGNLEVLNSASVVGTLTSNTINNTGVANSAPLTITATGTNNNIVITSSANTNLVATTAIKLNSNDIQIGSNQSAAANNTITLGSVSSLTTTNVPYLFKTNSITGYNAATALSLNNGVINIGYNQGIAANNTVNIGAITSNTQVNINGVLTINYNLGSINVNSVLSQFV